MATSPHLTACGASTNPFDLYRDHIAGRSFECTGLKALGMLPAVQRHNKGDCVLAVPALKIQSKKPGEMANPIGTKVRACGRSVCATADHLCSSWSRHSSSNP